MPADGPQSEHTNPPVAAAEALSLSPGPPGAGTSTEASPSSADTSTATASQPAAPASSAQDPDSVMDACLMTGLHLVPDSELPLLTSNSYAIYMLQGKPAGWALHHHAGCKQHSTCCDLIARVLCFLNLAHSCESRLPIHRVLGEQEHLSSFCPRCQPVHIHSVLAVGRCNCGHQKDQLQEVVKAAQHF